MDEEETNGDPAFWLPPGTSIVTPERLLKGDMDDTSADAAGNIRTAQAKRMNILNFVHESGIIDDQQLADANTYETWRSLFRAFTKSGLQAPTHVTTDPNGCKIREYGFVLLVKRLRKLDKLTIDYAIDAYSTNAERLLIIPPISYPPERRDEARARRVRYMSAMHALTALMPGIRDDLKRIEERMAGQPEEDLWESLRLLIKNFGIQG